MEQAITNDLILRCIFKHLPTPELVKNCRLVSRQWNLAATEALKKRRDAYIKVDSATDFEALTACIKNSANFPFREIDLTCIAKDFGYSPKKWLEVELLQQFSTLFTRLRISIRCTRDNLITALLWGHFKHIESLTLNPIQRIPKKRRPTTKFSWDQANSVTFEKLSTITLGEKTYCDSVSLSFLVALLNSCPHLERIDNFTNFHLWVLSSSGKLGLVKSLRVCRCINHYNHYPTPSGLEKLTIVDEYHHHENNKYEDRGRFQEHKLKFVCLRPLLESSRKTLRRLEVRCQLSDRTESDDWPEMINLSSLQLMEPFLFPHSVEGIFPTLQEIQLGNCVNEYAESVCDFFWKKSLPSVTKLEVFPCLYEKNWARLSQALPNVRRIFLHNHRCGYHIDDSSLYQEDENERIIDPLDGVGHFKQLETLCIWPMELPTANLDRFFTGLPEAFVKKLIANPQLPVPSPEYIDIMLRERKSILSVPGLKELVILFTVSDEVTQEEWKTYRPITHVAMDYALYMIPADLKIYFLYDHSNENAKFIEDILSPAAARVHLGHWNAKLSCLPKVRALDTLF